MIRSESIPLKFVLGKYVRFVNASLIDGNVPVNSTFVPLGPLVMMVWNGGVPFVVIVIVNPLVRLSVRMPLVTVNRINI